MTGEDLAKGMWDDLSPSTPEHLVAIEAESYREAKLMFEKYPAKAKDYLFAFVDDWELKKILKDMYVWQRVEAAEKGILRAIKENK